jgi:ribosomal protein L11 methyltransferase
MKFLKYELFFDNINDFFIEELNCYLIENFNNSLEEVYTGNNKNFFLYVEDRNILNRLKDLAKIYNINVEYRFVEEIDNSYLYKWKKNYKPVTIDNIVVTPTWIDINEKSKIIIKIDPQTAFGTGHHESTNLAIKAINNISNKEKCFSMLDAGTGSGILSIVGFKKGIKEIVSFDNDFDAVKVAKENFLKNGFQNFSLICGNYLCLKNYEKFDIVIANIISSVLLEMKNFLKISTKKDGFLILSGILKEESFVFKKLFDFSGFQIVEEFFLNEWCCIVAKQRIGG